MARARKPAKKRRTPKQTPAQLARGGKIEALFAMTDLDSATKADRDAYKWLCAARDFGHRKADDRIGDVLEVSSLRYDDSRYETAAAHWELACAYLEGADGLPRDLALAKKHLALAFEHHRSVDEINAGTGESYDADEIREGLDDDARAILDAAIAGDDYARAIRLLVQIRRLIELNAPEVIVDDLRRVLRDTVGAICPEPTAEYIERMGFDPLVDELQLTEATVAAQTAKLALLRAEHAKRLRERGVTDS